MTRMGSHELLEERACSDSIYLFLLRQKDVNLLRLKKVILLKNTNDPKLLRLDYLKIAYYLYIQTFSLLDFGSKEWY